MPDQISQPDDYDSFITSHAARPADIAHISGRCFAWRTTISFLASDIVGRFSIGISLFQLFIISLEPISASRCHYSFRCLKGRHFPSAASSFHHF